MRPIKLEFEGIKSYTTKATVDFTKLTNEGIFGIFGNTGSGKSTILDSMLLALYGRLPKTREAIDFVNYNCQTAFVDFTFSMKEAGGENVYRVWHEYKMKLQPRKLASHKALMTKFEGGEEIPLAEGADKVTQKVEEIVGLKMEDFEKCIILPQGEFAAFVTLQKQPRLTMMSTLFGLDKYGAKLVSLLKQNISFVESEIHALDRKLEAYSDCTKVALNDMKNSISEKENQIEFENINFSKIKDNFLKIEKNYDTRKKLFDLNERLSTLKKLEPEMRQKRDYADKYFLAKETKSLFIEKEKFSQLIAAENNELNELKKQLMSVEEKLESLALKKDEMSLLDSRLDYMKTTLIAIDSLFDDIEANKVRQKQLGELRESLIKKMSEKSSCESQLSAVTKKLDELTAKIENKNLKGEISVVLSKLEVVAVSEVLLGEINFLRSILCDATLALREKIDERIKELEESCDFSSNVTVKELVSKLKKLYDENDEDEKGKHSLSDQKTLFEAKLSNISFELQKVTADGVNIKNEFEKTKEKIDKILGGKIYSDYKKQLMDDISKIKEEKDNFANEKKNLTEKRVKLQQEMSVVQAKIDEHEKIFAEKNKAYETMLSENFSDVSQINKILAIVSDYGLIKSTTDKFFQDIFAVEQQIVAIEKEVGEVVISDEDYQKSKEEFEKAKENLEDLNKNIYNLRENYEKLSQKFEERCIIEAEKSDYEKDFVLNSSLFDVVRSNGLVEFVADEYLKEIAAVAKVTLLSLTDGKFGLCYNGDFLIEDNVLGGEKRKVDTVSGGELFLVSLSLALALSKSIYAKSQRPIEFFFLDEGFGSLDKDLVETVMDSLMKLKDSHLTIGVISHVESLKERIGAKICVVGATEASGSTLSIE